MALNKAYTLYISISQSWKPGFHTMLNPCFPVREMRVPLIMRLSCMEGRMRRSRGTLLLASLRSPSSPFRIHSLPWHYRLGDRKGIHLACKKTSNQQPQRFHLGRPLGNWPNLEQFVEETGWFNKNRHSRSLVVVIHVMMCLSSP